jgi:hypothetical protein
MFLIVTSSEGSSPITITLTYADGTESKNYTCADYGQPWSVSATDPDWTLLINNLPKWDTPPSDVMSETGNHSINALNIKPTMTRTLLSLNVSLTSSSSTLIFWGATGVLTAPVSVHQQPARAAAGCGAAGAASVTALGRNEFRFANIPAGAELSLFSIDGSLVARVPAHAGNFMWNISGSQKPAAAAGVRFCTVRSAVGSSTIRVTATP